MYKGENMQLVIKIENGNLIDHPILFENLQMLYPGIDYENLPSGYIKFTRVERPNLEPKKVVSTSSVYIIEDGIAKDHWEVRDLTNEERANKIQELYDMRAHPSWIIDEEELTLTPPVPYPNDDKNYYWDENTLSWIEITI